MISPPPQSDSSHLQLCSSDSLPLCCCGEGGVLVDAPPSCCCCCLDELDRSMATSSSVSSSSSSASRVALLRRSGSSQKESTRVESDVGGLEHFLAISRDFLCIPVGGVRSDSVRPANTLTFLRLIVEQRRTFKFFTERF